MTEPLNKPEVELVGEILSRERTRALAGLAKAQASSNIDEADEQIWKAGRLTNILIKMDYPVGTSCPSTSD